MVLRVSSQLSSCLTSSLTQHPPLSILGLESTFRVCHRAYVTAQKQKGPSSKRLKGTKPRDQYAVNQAEQRRAANISRQAVLKEERAKSMGDPIRGVTTPFLESLDTGIETPAEPTVEVMSTETRSENSDQPSPTAASARKGGLLNYYLTEAELERALEYSRTLTEPLQQSDRDTADIAAEEYAASEHAAQHSASQEAISRIVDLGNASSKERTRANVRRIIHIFGRHSTDVYLRPKAASSARLNSIVSEPDPLESDTIAQESEDGTLDPLADKPEPNPTAEIDAESTSTQEPDEVASEPAASKPVSIFRAGPDTGSSEVQIGILTAKIRILADRYAGENRNDKVNKRNLRLLLHRRQKLLKYMEKKERGSDRWQNMIEKLGLTEATWKGEIEVR